MEKLRESRNAFPPTFLAFISGERGGKSYNIFLCIYFPHIFYDIQTWQSFFILVLKPNPVGGKYWGKVKGIKCKRNFKNFALVRLFMDK